MLEFKKEAHFSVTIVMIQAETWENIWVKNIKIMSDCFKTNREEARAEKKDILTESMNYW